MVTIKISHLGNNMINFQIFNQYNERLSTLSKTKRLDQKEKYQEKLRKLFMVRGQYVTVNDLTK